MSEKYILTALCRCGHHLLNHAEGVCRAWYEDEGTGEIKVCECEEYEIDLMTGA